VPAKPRKKQSAKDPLEGPGELHGNIDVIHSPASNAWRLQERARHKAAMAQIDLELAEDVTSRRKLNLPLLNNSPASSTAHAEIEDWLREFGPFRDRPDKRERSTEWESRRLREAKAKFRGRKITQTLLRRLSHTRG
jgi:hypothetical protein